MSSSTTAPMQPLELDAEGTIRFRPNAIVRYLLDASSAGRKTDLNDLAIMPFSNEDRQQLAQLIGYSLSGYGELPYVDDAAWDAADEAARPLRTRVPDEDSGPAVKACPWPGRMTHCYHLVTAHGSLLGDSPAGSEAWACCWCGETEVRRWVAVQDPAHGTRANAKLKEYAAPDAVQV